MMGQKWLQFRCPYYYFRLLFVTNEFVQLVIKVLELDGPQPIHSQSTKCLHKLEKLVVFQNISRQRPIPVLLRFILSEEII